MIQSSFFLDNVPLSININLCKSVSASQDPSMMWLTSKISEDSEASCLNHSPHPKVGDLWSPTFVYHHHP